MTKSAAKEGRKANRRGAARLAAVQALYQMDIATTPLNEILAEFESHWLGREVDGSTYLPAEAAFFREIVGGFLREQRRLDPLIDRALAGGWAPKRAEALARARGRLAAQAGRGPVARRAAGGRVRARPAPRRSRARRDLRICRRRQCIP